MTSCKVTFLAFITSLPQVLGVPRAAGMAQIPAQCRPETELCGYSTSRCHGSMQRGHQLPDWLLLFLHLDWGAAPGDSHDALVGWNQGRKSNVARLPHLTETHRLCPTLNESIALRSSLCMPIAAWYVLFPSWYVFLLMEDAYNPYCTCHLFPIILLFCSAAWTYAYAFGSWKIHLCPLLPLNVSNFFLNLGWHSALDRVVFLARNFCITTRVPSEYAQRQTCGLLKSTQLEDLHISHAGMEVTCLVPESCPFSLPTTNITDSHRSRGHSEWARPAHLYWWVILSHVELMEIYTVEVSRVVCGFSILFTFKDLNCLLLSTVKLKSCLPHCFGQALFKCLLLSVQNMLFIVFSCCREARAPIPIGQVLGPFMLTKHLHTWIWIIYMTRRHVHF